jgi:hypothetical protein
LFHGRIRQLHCRLMADLVAGRKKDRLCFKSCRESGYLDQGCEIGTRYTITIFPCFPGRAILHGLIASPTGLSRQHEDDLLLFIDFIEEPVGADPVAPRLRNRAALSIEDRRIREAFSSASPASAPICFVKSIRSRILSKRKVHINQRT